MTLKEHLGEIIAFITGGGMLTILNFFRDKKKDKVEEFEKIIEQWKKILDEVKENERACEERYQRLSDEFEELKRSFTALQKGLSKPRKSHTDETK